MKIEKTLITCKPTEFMVQTNKIRRLAKEWLTATDIMNIRKRLPKIPDDATPTEAKMFMAEQGSKNLEAILEVIFEEHPLETLEILGAICFIDKEHIDDYEVKDFLAVLASIVNDEDVVSFFSSLMRLV